MFKKHKILFYILPLLAILVMAVVIVPPMVHLEVFKPKIENIITSKTGIPVKVNGNIHISLLGGATIVAEDISVPNGVISSCEFAIPFFDIFDLNNAKLSNDIIVNKASLLITKIVPFDIDTNIIVKDSKIQFLNKEYKIINGEFSKNNVHALVRTDQHKYEISSSNKFFVVNNNNNNLKLSGELFDDGTAKAHIDIIAKDINKWFEFETPRITGQFPVISDVKWNGSYGVEFNDISAQNISGNIHLQEDGYKVIKLSSKNSDYDLSFLAKNPEIFQQSVLDLDFYGKLKFFDKTFRHVVINTIGHDKKVEIKTIIADDLTATGGIIDEFGAHNINIKSKQDGTNTTCLFNGTPTEWSCEEFSYGDIIYGKLNVSKENFTANIKSNKKISNLKNIMKHTEIFGDTGIIVFDFPNMSGKITIKDKKQNIEYNHLDNKSLQEFGVNLPFIPEFMRFEKGDFVWDKTTMLFTPNSKTWQLSTNNDSFIIIGDNFKKWFPKTNLESLRNSDYTISGNYKKGNISDLKIEISGHTFTGSATNESITLKTDLLNIDELTDKEFKENYEERSFFVRSPITIPFKLNANVALSANKLIYNNKTYNNFVYSLHQDVQTFSITDSDRGNLLATLKKDKIKYDINVQLNKFMVDEKILPLNMPLNISNTAITAEIKLKTYGKIAHDLKDNLNGTFDASFDSGVLYGIGIDDFYASAKNITTLNAEDFLTRTLSDGTSIIKKMRIIGTYEKGDIKTTSPLTLSLRHVDGSGIFEIKNNQIFSKLKLLLRGTSASPEPIDLTIYPDNNRDFSLSEIMMNLDPEYMRTFTQTHNKF